MTRTHWRRPVPMGEAVSAALRRLGLETRFRQEQIWTVWSAVVGPQIARHAQPYAVRQGRLIVHVSDPVWLHHLSMMRHRVVAALNERLDTLVIRENRASCGGTARSPPGPSPSPLARGGDGRTGSRPPGQSRIGPGDTRGCTLHGGGAPTVAARRPREPQDPLWSKVTQSVAAEPRCPQPESAEEFSPPEYSFLPFIFQLVKF